MANYDSWTVSNNFKVKDPLAVREKLIDYGVSSLDIDISGHNIEFGLFDWFYHEDDWSGDNLLLMIQEQLEEDSVCSIYSVGHEKLKYVDGSVTVINKDFIFTDTIYDLNRYITQRLELKRIESYIAKNQKVVIYSNDNKLFNGSLIYRLLSDIVEDITQKIGGVFSFMHCEDLDDTTIREIVRLLEPGEVMKITRLYGGEKETITLTK